MYGARIFNIIGLLSSNEVALDVHRFR
jgi:hypothetical protein